MMNLGMQGWGRWSGGWDVQDAGIGSLSREESVHESERESERGVQLTAHDCCFLMAYEISSL